LVRDKNDSLESKNKADKKKEFNIMLNYKPRN